MKELVIIDMDGVIVKGQSQQLLLKYLLKNKLINWFVYFKIIFWFISYKTGIVKNPYKVMKYAFGFLKGKNLGEVEKILDDFFENTLKKKIFREAVEMINEHKNNNRELIIVSNAVDLIVKRMAEFLNIKNYIGTKLEIINNKFTGEIDGEIVYSDNKVNFVADFVKKNNLNTKNNWAYGDHITDLSILKISSHPVAVNPDRFLAKEAQVKHWPILNFKTLLVK